MGLTGQHKKQIGLRYVRNWIGRGGIATGTNTYSLILSPHLEQYYTEQIIEVTFTNANTGASTINIDGLGAVAIKKNGSSALTSGDIAAGQTLLLSYDGTNFQIVGGASGGGSSITGVLLGTRNIFVSKQGIALGTVGDESKSFLTIGAALTAAAALTPSSTNPINIIIYPGEYIENITVPSFINLVCAIQSPFIFTGTAAPLVNQTNILGAVYLNGTITQSGNNVNIIGINCNTLNITVTNSASLYSSFVVSTLISNTNGSTTDQGNWFDVHSLSFLPDCEIGGIYSYCFSALKSWGSSSTANARNITGRMFFCVAGVATPSAHFASSIGAFNGGTISGNLKNCTCLSSTSFSSSTSGTGGTISGNLTDCTGLGNCFSSSGASFGGNIDGTLINCKTTGNYTFCSGFNGAGILGGTLINCSSTGNYSFCSANTATTVAATLGAFMRNCSAVGDYSFASTNTDNGTYSIDFGGNLIGCSAVGNYSFLSCNNATPGYVMTGTLNGCTANGNYSFASGNLSINKIFEDAKLLNCIATGNYSFGSGGRATTQSSGIIGGHLDGCISTGNYSFGSVDNLVNPGTARIDHATILNCKAYGDYSFASANTGNGYAIMENQNNFLSNCLATGNYSFCSTNLVTGVGGIDAILENCRAIGDASFAGSIDGRANGIFGTLINCIGGDHSFASSESETGGTIYGKLINCTGGTYCFASAKNAGTYTPGTIDTTAILENCTGTTRAFGFSQDQSILIFGTLINCDPGTEFGFAYTIFQGLMRNCRVTNVNTFNTVSVADGARFEYCQLKGDGSGFGIASWDGGNYNIDARHCDFFGTGIDGNLTNVTTTPYNTDDVNSIF